MLSLRAKKHFEKRHRKGRKVKANSFKRQMKEPSEMWSKRCEYLPKCSVMGHGGSSFKKEEKPQAAEVRKIRASMGSQLGSGR